MCKVVCSAPLYGGHVSNDHIPIRIFQRAFYDHSAFRHIGGDRVGTAYLDRQAAKILRAHVLIVSRLPTNIFLELHTSFLKLN